MLSKMRRMTELLTTAEVAERLQTTPRTINRWASSGRLPVALRLPGATGANLFDPEVVDAFAAGAAS